MIKLMSDVHPIYGCAGGEEALSHDAAVAHALVRAITDWQTTEQRDEYAAQIYRRAEKILRDEFGIEE